jgi:hypothetical protein
LTVGGDDPGKPCIFPFNHRGINYTKCPWLLIGDWCATKVDLHGVAMDNEGKWGTCGPECPKQSQISQTEFEKYFPIRENECKEKMSKVLKQVKPKNIFRKPM